MSAICELTNRKRQFGHNVSFSMRHTNRDWKLNLHKKTFLVNGQKVTMKLSAKAIRTLKKKGLLDNDIAQAS